MTEKRQFLRIAKKFMCNIGCTEWQFRPYGEGDRGAVLASGGGGVVKSIKSMPNLDPRSSRCDSLSTLLRMTCPHSRACRFGKMGNAVKTFFSSLLIVFATLFAAPAFAALPAGYQQVEYIESNGTQYFDTGIVGKSGVSVEAKFMLTTDANGSLFGNRQTDNTRFWPAMWFKGSGSNIWQWNATVNVDTLAGTVNKNTLYTTYFVSNSSGWTFDVNGERVSSGTQVGSNTNNVWMFGTNDGRTNTLQYPFVGKAYYAKIWQNGTLVRDFIPVKDSSGKFGMYDTVNNRFYTNQGTGEFTGGRAVCPNGELAQTYTTATGTVVQNGTPTPTNPIEPTFYQQGYLVLRKVGDVADSYDATTGKITRRVGVKELTGTEGTWRLRSESTDYKGFGLYDLSSWGFVFNTNQTWVSSHYVYNGGLSDGNNAKNPPVGFSVFSGTDKVVYFTTPTSVASTLEAFKQWLAQQYAAGTPVTVYYPLATPVEEDWAPEQCSSSSPIKIATTAYNTARFSPVVNDLNSAVATIREIVTKTINQTAAIASLQADKQTRPEDACPAGKKCLLVETEENGVIVPHWFPIIEAPEE